MRARKTSYSKDLATLQAIGRIYCDVHHGNASKDEAGLCRDCSNVISETLERSQSCPNGHQGNCQDCDIKCQRGRAQEDIRKIMAYSAPRMAFRHPLMTASYLKKKLRNLAVRRKTSKG